MSVRQVWKRKTSTPKSSPSSQKDSPLLPPRVYLQSPSPPLYNPLRDQMINQLHNISTILDSHTNPSNAYVHAPPSPPPQQIHPPSHAQDEMLRLDGLGSNTPSSVPCIDDKIMVIVHGSKQRGHIPGVGRVLSGNGTVILPSPSCTHSFDVAKLKKSEKLLTKQVNMFMKLFRSDDKFSQMLTQLESQPEYGDGSWSDECGDDEPGDDEDNG
nr:hypothetical protein [Tanacetum cinerariifolium]